MITVAILTISDKGARGERVDESGRLLRQLVEKLPGKVIAYEIIPDTRPLIAIGAEAAAFHDKLASGNRRRRPHIRNLRARTALTSTKCHRILTQN